ncbi:MAG: anaerobic ribonucleoside-triphosphate reductase activating protein [archaeon]|nr:MAG: anaerobic ribonucleoside-triphosphate reductase activating protein [archaeon]
MEIKGFEKFTLIDYPGKAAAVIFLSNCNFKCGFCHNSHLISQEKRSELKTYPKEEVFEHLKKNKGYIDGVVISGGEPTLYAELPLLISELKEMGFKVKLDTNGSHPEILFSLIKNKLVDYVAMDIKTNFNNYNKVCDGDVTGNVKKSIELIKTLKDYEFRTTVVPKVVDRESLLKIAAYLQLNGANKKFVLQQFLPQNCHDPAFLKLKKTSVDELKALQLELKPLFKSVEIRTE